MSELTVEIVRAVSDLSPDDKSGFLLQLPGFCNAVAPPQQPVFLVVKRREEVIATCGFVERTRRGMTEWLSPLFASFGGVRHPAAQIEPNASKRERAWREVLEVVSTAIPKSVDFAEIIFAPGDVDARALGWNGWDLRPHYNYVSRWEREGEWRQSLSSSTRRQERKALELGLKAEVRPAGDTDGLRRMWKSMAGRQELDAGLAGHLAGLGKWLEDQDRGFQVRVAKGIGEPAEAMALVGYDGHRVYYLAGASDPAMLGSGAPTLLHTAILEEIDRRGLPRCYDWVGANTPGVAQFKRGFGPELEVLIAARHRSWKRRMAEGARQWLRR